MSSALSAKRRDGVVSQVLPDLSDELADLPETALSSGSTALMGRGGSTMKPEVGNERCPPHHLVDNEIAIVGSTDNGLEHTYEAVAMLVGQEPCRQILGMLEEPWPLASQVSVADLAQPSRLARALTSLFRLAERGGGLLSGVRLVRCCVRLLGPGASLAAIAPAPTRTGTWRNVARADRWAAGRPEPFRARKRNRASACFGARCAVAGSDLRR